MSVPKSKSYPSEGNALAIYIRLKNDITFQPDEHKAMKLAYEGILIDLGIVNRADPVTELIAERLIAYAALGEGDPAKLRERVAEEFKNVTSDSAFVIVSPC